jgi:hypothetical protein
MEVWISQNLKLTKEVMNCSQIDNLFNSIHKAVRNLRYGSYLIMEGGYKGMVTLSHLPIVYRKENTKSIFVDNL